MQLWKLKNQIISVEGTPCESTNTSYYIQSIPWAQSHVFIARDVGFRILSSDLYEQIRSLLLDSLERILFNHYLWQEEAVAKQDLRAEWNVKKGYNDTKSL